MMTLRAPSPAGTPRAPTLLACLACALAVSACPASSPSSTTSAPPPPAAPPPPPAAPSVAPSPSSSSGGPIAPVTTCTVDLPAGWTQSPSPMPDHVLEAIRGTPGQGSLGTLVVDEMAGVSSLDDALAAVKQQMLTSYGAEAEFEQRLAGPVLIYTWRTGGAGSPMARRMITVQVVPVAGRAAVVVRAALDDAAGTEVPLISIAASLRCRPRS